MVKVAIAAASSQLAKEVIDKLVEAKKHEIIGLVRKDPAQYPPVHSDPGSVIQKRLIDASIESGVKRIAPSEWATGVKLEDSLDVIPWYAGKVDVARYLEEVNKEKKVIEYTRFQVGSFMNYLSHPQGGTKHVSTLPFLFLFEKQQASAIEGALDDAVSWITVQDIAGVVARAVEYEGEWPAIGGMVGTRVTVAEMLKLGESIGRPFTVKWLKLEDLEAKAKGVPPAMNESFDIHNSAPEDVEAFLEYATESLLQGIHRGAYDVTDEWNKLLPDYKFTQVGDYIKKYWGPK